MIERLEILARQIGFHGFYYYEGRSGIYAKFDDDSQRQTAAINAGLADRNGNLIPDFRYGRDPQLINTHERWERAAMQIHIDMRNYFKKGKV
jgi:hypothetical protein